MSRPVKSIALKLPPVAIHNRQRAIRLDLPRLRAVAQAALPLCLARPGPGRAPLPTLRELSAALVSDRAIARTHWQFLRVRGATDVITFEHGELVVSAATAARESTARGEPLERELARYVVHGLLHLNGHEDAEPGESAAMWAAQEAVLAEAWGAGE